MSDRATDVAQLPLRSLVRRSMNVRMVYRDGKYVMRFSCCAMRPEKGGRFRTFKKAVGPRRAHFRLLASENEFLMKASMGHF